jgi:hypothetical protein
LNSIITADLPQRYDCTNPARGRWYGPDPAMKTRSSPYLTTAPMFIGFTVVYASNNCQNSIPGLPSQCSLSSNCLELTCSVSVAGETLTLKGGVEACSDAPSMGMEFDLNGKKVLSKTLQAGSETAIPGLKISGKLRSMP